MQPEARAGAGVGAMLDRFTCATLSIVCAAGIVLWGYEQHDNLRLRAELARATERADLAAMRGVAGNSPLPQAASGAGQRELGGPRNSTGDVPSMLAAAEVEPMLRRIIHDHLLVRNPDQMTRLMSRIASADMPRAFAFVDHNTVGAARFRLRNELLTAWAKEDPAAAARAADSFPVRDRQLARQEVAMQWSKTDPEAAARYCPESYAFVRWVERAPAKAAELAETLPTAKDAIGRVAFEWAQKQPDAAWTWASGLPDALRYTGVEEVIAAVARTDPQKAVACLASQPTAPPYDNLPKLIAEPWARDDPTAAAQWASALPASDGRAAALEAVVQGWTESDTAGAATWVENVPRSWPERDVLLDRFAFLALDYAPELAAHAAVKIQSEPRRDAEIERIASYWLHLDPNRAEAWLSGVSLSPAARQQLHLEGYRNLPGDPVGGS